MAGLSPRFPVYSRLLRLYPPTYYKRYGEQMLLTLADMLDAHPSRKRRLAIWLHICRDLLASVAVQQLTYASDVLVHETPPFVQRSALVSLLLFLPFFAIAVTNDIAAHTFYHTWLWQHAVLLTWIAVLPALGFVLSIITFCVWMAKAGSARWRRLSDFYQSWVLLLPLLVGAGILVAVSYIF